MLPRIPGGAPLLVLLALQACAAASTQAEGVEAAASWAEPAAGRDGARAVEAAPEGDDDAPPPATVDVTPPQAPPAADTPGPRAAPVADLVPSPSPPPAADAPAPIRRVLLLGDSKIATDFGAALERELAARPDLSVARRGKSATGLARPDYFDWMAEARRQLSRHHPDLVIVALGGNDGQDLPPRDRGDRRVFWKSAAWPEAYGARVTALLELLAGDDRRVVWLEVTTADRPHLEGKLCLIREVQRDAVDRFGPRATYLETHHHFYADDGALLRRVEVDRRLQPLRMDDGIHFSVPGSRWLAPRVSAELLAQVGL